VKGTPVQVGGVPVGSVSGIRIADDGRAEIELEIDAEHAPLRVGTRAEIRQFSQSGLANRYVDLSLPPHSDNEIPDGAGPVASACSPSFRRLGPSPPTRSPPSAI